MKRIVLISCVLAWSACSSKEQGQPGATAESESSSGGEQTYTAPAAHSDAGRDVHHSNADTYPAQHPAPSATAPEASSTGSSEIASPASETRARESGAASGATAADDTGRNDRDAVSNTVTPTDQRENTSDLELTRRIRQAIVGDDNLGFNAKNVKIVAQKGRVTLRGPVASDAERKTIIAHAQRIAGANLVDPQLEVAR